MSTFLYNPDRKSKDLLISEFVVRTQVYENIMHDLETSKMEHPEQHYLLVGQRGAGKTTLLHRIKYGIEDSDKLNPWLIPILFTEEQYNVSELANLWESIAQFLEDYQGFFGISSEIEEHLDKKNFEELAFDVLENYLDKHKKKLVLLIDNIGDILKKLDKTEVHRLREILQTKKEIRLIAGSPFYLDSILDYQQPFFEFFKAIRLDGLTQQETIDLLLQLGEVNNKKGEIERIIKETPERILTLRTLTGGVPRTIALMFNIFIDYNDEGSVKDLERILDTVTPLYKHRMDDLPSQQQKIVDAVAKNWDAISVKELKEKVRLESKIISAQLRQLEKNQIIDKKETGTKNHLYLLRERFFNIWYLMRYGRKDDRQRVIWLVRFLESWCSSKDITNRVLDYIKKVHNGSLDISTKEILGQTYAAFSTLDIDTKILLKNTVPHNISKHIQITNKELCIEMKKHQEKEDWAKVLELANNIEGSDSQVRKIIYSASIELFTKEPNYKAFENITDKIRQEISNRKNNSNNAINVKITESELIILGALTFFFINKSILSNELEASFTLLNIYIKTIPTLDESSFEFTVINELFCLILAKENYNLLLKVFKDIKTYKLKDLFKPIYIALKLLNEGTNSNEYLRSGPEMRETIEDIITRANDYKKELLSHNISNINPKA